MRSVVSPDRDISTSEGQRPGLSTAVLRSVNDVYIKDAPTSVQVGGIHDCAG